MGFTARLGELIVDVVTRERIDSELSAIQGKFSAWTGRLGKGLSIPVSIGTAVGGAAAARFLLDATQKASDLSETMSKTDQVFGKSTGLITTFADEMANKFGAVKRTILDASSMFGLVLQGAGMSADASAKLSISLARLADDASSFFNVPLDVALEKIRAGLSGEAEPLRAFGVMLSEDEVKAKALAMGLVKSGGELTNTSKVMARAQLITEGLSKASGDHERTLGGLANQQRKMTGEIENFQAEIGKELIPAMADAIKLITEMGSAMEGTAQGGAKTLGESLDAIINGLRGIAGAMPGQGPDQFEQGSFFGNMFAVGSTDLVGTVLNTTGNWDERRKRLYEEMVDSIFKGMQVQAGPINPGDPRRFPSGLPRQEAEKQAAAATAAQTAAAASAAFQADMKAHGRSFLEQAAWQNMTVSDRLRATMSGGTNFGGGLLGGFVGGLERQRLAEMSFENPADMQRPFSAQSFSGAGAAMDQLQLDVLSQGKDQAKEQTEQIKKNVEIAGKQLEKLGEIASKLAGKFTAVARGPE